MLIKQLLGHLQFYFNTRCIENVTSQSKILKSPEGLNTRQRSLCLDCGGQVRKTLARDSLTLAYLQHKQKVEDKSTVNNLRSRPSNIHVCAMEMHPPPPR